MKKDDARYMELYKIVEDLLLIDPPCCKVGEVVERNIDFIVNALGFELEK